MPYYIKIDFRFDGTLGAWHSRDEPSSYPASKLTTTISKTRVRDVLIALANELDPVVKKPKVAK